MSRREKIMLFMALAALFYGVLEWGVFSSDKPPVSPVAENKASSAHTADKMMAKIAQVEIEHPHKKEIVAKIETPWEKDPFVQSEPKNESSEVTSPETEFFLPDLVYSGFIFSGDRAMAIIDGNEYFVGDTIVDTGYRVIRITSDKVVIQKDQNTGDIFFNGD
jgi:hypothetical protein